MWYDYIHSVFSPPPFFSSFSSFLFLFVEEVVVWLSLGLLPNSCSGILKAGTCPSFWGAKMR